MTTYVFLIQTLTNLHAGGGDAGGYGVVDKLVQRDAATNLPTIHASSIKGALREYFTESKVLTAPEIERIFGASPKPPKPGEEREPKRGEYRFFSADLLALPEPHDEAPHFHLRANAKHTETLQKRFVHLGAAGLELHNEEALEGDLKELADELPVIARNYLDNGVSKNLWYEEVIPRETIFVTCFQADDDVLANLLDKNVLQLGGNATVGYGFCRFIKLLPKT